MRSKPQLSCELDHSPVSPYKYAFLLKSSGLNLVNLETQNLIPKSLFP
jgi:hypothetical protein